MARPHRSARHLCQTHGTGHAAVQRSSVASPCRVTGALYLTIAVAGGFSIAYVPSQLYVADNAAATVENILAHRCLFNLGIAGDVVMMLAETLITAMLYFMFRPVNATLSPEAAFARLMIVAVMAAMLFFTWPRCRSPIRPRP